MKSTKYAKHQSLLPLEDEMKGYCQDCGEYAYLNEDGLCVECSRESDPNEDDER